MTRYEVGQLVWHPAEAFDSSYTSRFLLVKGIAEDTWQGSDSGGTTWCCPYNGGDRMATPEEEAAWRLGAEP